jgi:hypothetical protein
VTAVTYRVRCYTGSALVLAVLRFVVMVLSFATPSLITVEQALLPSSDTAGGYDQGVTGRSRRSPSTTTSTRSLKNAIRSVTSAASRSGAR